MCIILAFALGFESIVHTQLQYNTLLQFSAALLDLSDNYENKVIQIVPGHFAADTHYADSFNDVCSCTLSYIQNLVL